MISREWSEPRVILPAGLVEDPVFVRDVRGALWLYHTSGPSFQNQRLFRCRAETVFGPFAFPELVADVKTHTRIERGQIDRDTSIVSQVWPGLPKCGLWAYEHTALGNVRHVVVEPKDGTLYSVAACNPWAAWSKDKPGMVDILFEGRDERLFWRLFRASWKPGEGLAEVDPEPFLDAANPSVFTENGVRHLVYSRMTPAGFSGGFETCVATETRKAGP